MNVKLSNRQVQGLKMSNNRNSVQNLNNKEDVTRSNLPAEEAKYKDKSIKSRGNGIYLGFIDQAKNRKDPGNKRRQGSQINHSKLSGSSSNQIYYSKEPRKLLGNRTLSQMSENISGRSKQIDMIKGRPNGRNNLRPLQTGTPQKISSFDYVTPRNEDEDDQPDNNFSRILQTVNLGSLGDGQTAFAKQDLKDQSQKNQQSNKFQEQFKKRSLSSISKKDQCQSNEIFKNYNILKQTPTSSAFENSGQLYKTSSSFKAQNQDFQQTQKQVSQFDPSPVKWLHDPTAHKSRVRVVARFRPFNDIEKLLDKDARSPAMVTLDDFDQDSVVLKDNLQSSRGFKFKFDKVFTENASQRNIYDVCAKNVVRDALNGYNSTIMAYGQTGSGKTYTMFGPDILDSQTMGIIPRVSRDIFKAIQERYYMNETSSGQGESETEYQVKVQMVEIYKEAFVDLLAPSPQVTEDHLELQKSPAPPQIELKLKESTVKGVFVEGLTSVNVISEDELTQVLQLGELNRHVGQTQQNQYSSRSHSIFMIEIIQRFSNDSCKRGLINLVDLAGSERVSKSYAEGNALEEAKKINQSLSTLGQVIKAISKRSTHIPYRDSKLTRLLKESLGGNNKTTLIVNCSQHFSQYDETLSTLRFAQSAKMIENQVKVNVRHNSEIEQSEMLQNIIKQLKNELNLTKLEMTRLKSTLTTPGNQSMIFGQNPDEFDGPGDAQANSNLKQKVETLEAENKHLKKELESYKDQFQQNNQKQQNKNIHQDSLRIEELEFERNYQNLKIQNLEKDLHSQLETISRLEQTLQQNVQETRSMGIEKAQKFYSIQPILNRNLNMPNTIQQLFQPNSVAGKEGQLDNQFQLFSDIQEIDNMSKTTGLSSKYPLTVDLLIHQILMLTLKNQEQDRKLILTENNLSNKNLQIQLMENQINDLLQFQSTRKNIIDKLLRVNKDKLIIDQALQKIDKAIKYSVKGTPQMESPFLTRVNSPRKPTFVRSILKQGSGSNMGRMDTEPDIQNPTFGRKPQLAKKRTMNLPQQNIFTNNNNNQVKIIENNDENPKEDDSFVDDMSSVGESFCITQGPEFTDGNRVNTISNFDFGVKITNNNTSQVTNILATEYQGTVSNLNLKTEQDSPLQPKEESLQNSECPPLERGHLLQIYEMLTSIKEFQTEKIGVINQQNEELQAHLNQMQFQQIRKYQQQIQDCEQKYTKIVGNLEVRFYKDISAVKTWVSQIMKTVKQRVGIVVEKIANEKVNSQYDQEYLSTSSKGRVSKKERKMRAKSSGNHSFEESKHQSPNQFQSNPMNIYKSHYYNRIQVNERDSSAHSPVDLINYSLIKKGDSDLRVDTSINDSKQNYFTTSRILNTQGTPERNDRRQEAQKHKNSFSRNRSISKNSGEHGLSQKDCISDILSTGGNKPVKRQVDFIQSLKKTKPIAKVPYQIPSGASRDSKRDSSPSYGSDTSSRFKNQTNSSFKNQTLETDKSVSMIQPQPIQQKPSIPIQKKRQSLKFESKAFSSKKQNQSLNNLRNLSARRSSQNIASSTPKSTLKKTPSKSGLLKKPEAPEERKGEEKIKFKLVSRNKNLHSQSQNMFTKLSDIKTKSELNESNQQMNMTQKSSKFKIIKHKK